MEGLNKLEHAPGCVVYFHFHFHFRAAKLAHHHTQVGVGNACYRTSGSLSQACKQLHTEISVILPLSFSPMGSLPFRIIQHCHWLALAEL